MTAPTFNGCFPHSWQAQILPRRPMILPNRQYTYPGVVEEVENGALEVLVKPMEPNSQPFLATCALGFRDPAAPTGLWSMPNSNWLCAVSGGYAYLINTAEPEQFIMVRYRPVLDVQCYIPFGLRKKAWNSPDATIDGSVEASRASSDGLLLFIGHHSILAWGQGGEAWESERLSSEGVTVDEVDGRIIRGTGWDLMTDKDLPFTLDLHTGRRI